MRIFAMIFLIFINITNFEINFAEENQVQPVKLKSFTSLVIKNYVTLNWITERESDNSFFKIERTFNSSIEWAEAGSIAGNGNSNQSLNYTFTENLNSGKYSYRLKQIDINGNFEYINLSKMVEIGVPEEYNIFHRFSKIYFDLPYEGIVIISVYDNSGKEVTKVLDGYKTAGYYSVTFNGSDLSSGMYFYKIEAGSFVQTKRMILVK